jgi:hypothetical protein
MFDSMDAPVKVSLFLHAVPVPFHQTEGSFDSGAERLQFLIDDVVWYCSLK